MKFDNFCSEASKRLSSLENKSMSTDVKISALEEKVVSVGQNFDFLNEKFDDLSKQSKTDTTSLKTELVGANEKLLDLEKVINLAVAPLIA